LEGSEVGKFNAFRILEHDRCYKKVLPQEYERIANNFLDKSETDAKNLLQELKDLEAKIHKQLEDISIGQDYIRYSCSRCPGQARPSR